mmetsp:Transcript_16262/g.67277  ORF Transcript_16262/g.67277 Transcript_16262/m.67277 type:complete len:184 (-) Transcript_16262:2321-2872(-)
MQRTERGELPFRNAPPVAPAGLDEGPFRGAGAVQVDRPEEGSTVSRGAEGVCRLGGVALTEEDDTHIDAAEVAQDLYRGLSLAQGLVPAPVPGPTQDRRTALRVRGAPGGAVTPGAQGAIVATLPGREGALEVARQRNVRMTPARTDLMLRKIVWPCTHDQTPRVARGCRSSPITFDGLVLRS